MASGMGGRTVARPADRDGVDAVLGHRGLDPAAHAGLGRGYTDALDGHRRCCAPPGRPARRDRDGHRGRQLLRGVPDGRRARSRQPSQAQRGLESAGVARGRADARAYRHPHRDAAACTTATTSGWTCTGPPASPPLLTGVRSCSTSATAELAGAPARRRRAEGPRQPPPQGHRRSRSDSSSSTVDGLQEDFPALRTLGASSSLPVPTTHLVGREPASRSWPA